jgi:hypothetical protein
MAFASDDIEQNAYELQKRWAQKRLYVVISLGRRLTLKKSGNLRARLASQPGKEV